jgi:hypothetical protein
VGLIIVEFESFGLLWFHWFVMFVQLCWKLESLGCNLVILVEFMVEFPIYLTKHYRFFLFFLFIFYLRNYSLSK